MFTWLAKQAPAHGLAWDCATGNGQAAMALAAHFRKVVATDASSEQIRHASRKENVTYRVEEAEKSSLADNSVDLLMVAQAYHWFDHDAFQSEADRVVKAAGLLVVGSYQLVSVNREIDRVIYRLWGQILDGYWPPERALVDSGLSSLSLLWPEIEKPSFEMSVHWELAELLAYLGTWSAVHKYAALNKTGPLELISPELERAWGEPERKRRVSWPINLRVCRKPG
jgi:ubiquinone/menaquinone biosynthesis C-methylase UbiE